jgi:hypothetical protein
MSSSRWTLAPGVAAAGIVAAGLAVGAAAYLGTEGVSAQSASSGPSLEFVPEGATLVGYVDLKAVASSPLAETLSDATRNQGQFGELETFEEATSIDVLDDVDSATLAVGPGAGKKERWGMVVQGVFGRARLLEKLAASKNVVETSTYEGTTVYSIQSGTESTAMALPDDSILLFGEPSYVRDMLDAGAGRKPSATGIVSSLRYGGFEGETFWFAGAPPDFVHGLVGREKKASTLRSFAVTGRLDTDLVVRARAEAIDAAKAQELADVLRGLVAFGRLQQGDAGLGKILESISVDLVDDEIDVNLLVPYESIRELLDKKSREATAR